MNLARIFSTLSVCLLGAVLATSPAVAGDTLSETLVPAPGLSPAEVVRIQIEALRDNDAEDRGIGIAFRFASPSNRRSTGPVERFGQMIRGGAYGLMLAHEHAVYGEVEVREDRARVPVTLIGRNEAIRYVFYLSRQAGAPYTNCWMTDAVTLEGAGRAFGLNRMRLHEASRALALAASLALVPVAGAAPATLLHGADADALATANAAQFAEDARAVTAGVVDLVLTVAAGGRRSVADAVRRGEAAVGVVLLSDLDGHDPFFALESVPFLVATFEKAVKLERLAADGRQRRLHAIGLELLYAFPLPPRRIYARRAVTEMAHLGGARVADEGILARRFAQRVGAQVVPVPDEGIPAAISAGRLDWFFATPAEALAAGPARGTYLKTVAWFPRVALVMNAALHASLPARAREALALAAAEGARRGWRLARARTREDLAALAASGVEPAVPSATVRTGLREISRSIAVGWSERVGGDSVPVMDAFYSDD